MDIQTARQLGLSIEFRKLEKLSFLLTACCRVYVTSLRREES